MSLGVNEEAAGSPPAASDVGAVTGQEGPSPSDSGVKDQSFDVSAIVRDVVQPKPDTAGEASPAAEEVKTDATSQEKAEGPAAPSDDDKPPPFAEHPAWKRQLTLRRKAEEKVKELEPLAESHRQVQTFLSSHNLSIEEGADALMTFALAKSDPVAAWEKIRPFAEDVARRAGVLLDDGLNSRVQSGELSPQAARELALANARATTLEQRQAQERERAQREEAERFTTGIQQTVSDWWSDRKLKDPNFEQKQPALEMAILKVRQDKGPPRSFDEVKAQLNEAYSIVNSMFPAAPTAPAAQTRQPQQPIRTTPVSGNAQPKPRSIQDAVYAAVGLTPPR